MALFSAPGTCLRKALPGRMRKLGRRDAQPRMLSGGPRWGPRRCEVAIYAHPAQCENAVKEKCKETWIKEWQTEFTKDWKEQIDPAYTRLRDLLEKARKANWP